MSALVMRQKVIPYGAAKYRSVLEARYAALFGALKVRFTYEPMRLKISRSSGYTPDFWLPDHESYLEVKGMWHTGTPDRPLSLAARLAAWSGCPVYLAFGDFPQAQEDAASRWNMLRVPDSWCVGDPIPDMDYAWTLCLHCNRAYIYSAAQPECSFCGVGHGDTVWQSHGGFAHQIRNAFYVGNRRF